MNLSRTLQRGDDITKRHLLVISLISPPSLEEGYLHLNVLFLRIGFEELGDRRQNTLHTVDVTFDLLTGVVLFHSF